MLPSDPSADGEARVFQLTLRTPAQGARQLRIFGIVMGLAFVVGWGLFVLPLLLQAPHSFTACSKGGCYLVPAADYYATVEGYTVLVSVPAAVFFGIAVSTLRQLATELRVDASGFTIVYGTKRRKRVAWADRGLDCFLQDFREALRAHPPLPRNYPDPVLLSSGRATVYPELPALDAVLSSARAAGLEVQQTRGGPRTYRETIGYRVVPGPTSARSRGTPARQ